jgi:Calx-beta domain-containing protein
MEEGKPRRSERKDGARVEHSVMLDPRDVHRYQRREGERKRKGSAAKLRYWAAAAVLVAAFLVYWNFESLRALVAGTQTASIPIPADEPDGDEAATARVDAAPAAREAPATPTPKPAAPPAADVPSETVAAPEPGPPAEPGSPAEADAVAAAPAPAPAPAEPAPPPPPVEPERFEFGLSINSVSEGDAAAAVLVLRNGGRRAASSVVWWTAPGTATAGADYADLGRVTLQFPAGAQNRTIRIPIVGDRLVEGPESFYVHIAVPDGAGAAAEPAPTEVTISDDD